LNDRWRSIAFLRYIDLGRMRVVVILARGEGLNRVSESLFTSIQASKVR